MYSYYERAQKNSIVDGTILDDGTHQFKGKWDVSGLREQCQQSDVEQNYRIYMKRLKSNLLVNFFWITLGSVCFFSLVLYAASEAPKVDIIIYISFTVLAVAILSANLFMGRGYSNSWISLTTTFVALSLLVTMDISIPILHSMIHNEVYIPMYYGYLICSIYVYLPIYKYLWPFIFGVFFSTYYIVALALVTYRTEYNGIVEFDRAKIISECLYISCLNFLGIYIRLTSEIVIRTIFIDKRECVEENFLRLAAKGQERILLISMIPEQIAEKMEDDIQMRLIHLSVLSRARRPSEKKLFLETHDDVTILYADMVNFTYLSTTLNVKALVGTLHDLYVRFDDAALGYNVLRIQFLGDCYYCVANVSTPNPEHASSCVKLGLQMISDINNVNDERDLEMSLRIGVHSGRVLSGVIGTNKWQFDIYSKDVDIANRLETTGEPDRVHISDSTLQHLDDEFRYEDGPEQAQNDPLLQKFHIKTYLIIQDMLPSLPNIKSVSSAKFSLHDFSSHDLVDPKSVYSGEVLQRMVELEMGRESVTIPVETIQFRKLFLGKSRNLTRFEKMERNFRVNFSWWFVCFKKWRWEYNYMIQPDPLFKHSVLFSVVLVCYTICLQAVNAPQKLSFWIVVVFGVIAMLFLLVVVWYKKIWGFQNKKWYITKPTNKIGRWLFKHSDFAESNMYFRMFVYMMILCLQLWYTLVQLVDCNRFKVENEEMEFILLDERVSNNLCFNPWAVTQSILLNLIITFSFSRITYILKLIIGHTVVICYIIVILATHDFIYERSVTCNDKFNSEYAHIFIVCSAISLLILVTRQLEFINRVGYYWKRELRKNQYDAKFTNHTITRLISNILPSHIVDIYMDNQLSNELYHEEYTNVAVMFATILNFDIETAGLRMLNEIICDFDEVLTKFRGVKKVEKIKAAGWTYMAACGLNTTGSGHRGSTTKTGSSFSLSSKWRKRKLMSKLRRVSEQVIEYTNYTPRPSTASFGRRRSVRMFNDEEEPTMDDDVVCVMARFALELLRSIKQFNMQNIYMDAETRLNGSLRIGIASGPVMAGVVGLYKPHYDIWGNAVNMASRMDSTGVPNFIQVTEEAANALEYNKVKCRYRDIIMVKGRGPVPTYFIDIDEELNFKKLSESGPETDLET